jgi:hypothetical protein
LRPMFGDTQQSYGGLRRNAKPRALPPRSCSKWAWPSGPSQPRNRAVAHVVAPPDLRQGLRSTIVHDCVHTKPACLTSQCCLCGPAIGVLNVNDIGTAMNRRQLEVHREHARAQLSWAIRHGGDPELLDLIRFQIDRLTARIMLMAPPPLCPP